MCIRDRHRTAQAEDLGADPPDERGATHVVALVQDRLPAAAGADGWLPGARSEARVPLEDDRSAVEPELKTRSEGAIAGWRNTLDAGRRCVSVASEPSRLVQRD